MMANTGQRGVTLVEVVIILAISALVLAMGVPGFRALLGRAQRSSVLTEVGASLMYGRSEAVKQAVPVSLCAGDQDRGCDSRRPGDWSHGWIVFADTAGNGRVNTRDKILRVHHFKAPRFRLQGVDGLERGVTFRPSGFAQSSGRIDYCEADTGYGKHIILSAAGRIQVQDYPDCR